MADFNTGDRIVKMSGINAGKFGTINSISDSGTLNVTFDGERLPRYCDPERCGKIGLNVRVGDKVKVEWEYDANQKGIVGMTGEVLKVGSGTATVAIREKGNREYLVASHALKKVSNACRNAKFKVGDRVKSAKYPELGEMKVVRVFQDIHGTAYRTSRDGFLTDDIHYDRTLIPANARAANAKFKVGDKVAYSVFGQTKTGTVVEVAEKFHSEYGNEHEGEQTYMVDFGKKPYTKTWESRMTLANSRACNAWTDSAMLAMGDEVVEVKGDFALLHNRFGNDYAVKSRDGERWELGGISESDARRKFAAKAWNARACNAASDLRAYKLLDDGRAEIDMTTVGWKSRMHSKETLREMEEQAKKESVDTLKRVLATAKGTMLAKLAEKELARRGIKNACRNASIDDEFPKLKAMGKANAEKYLKDHAQELIDKYGHPELVKLAKKIQSIRLKPIKKGRFAGKSGDMTYYVDYTADSWFASKYGKDGTNVTEIQVTGPYVMDPDGKERRHILYSYSSGRESIPAENPQVAALVKRIMAGTDAVKQGDAAYAWNACAENAERPSRTITIGDFELHADTPDRIVKAFKDALRESKAIERRGDSSSSDVRAPFDKLMTPDITKWLV